MYEIIDDDSEHSSNSALPVRAPYYTRWNRARPSHIHISTLLSADHATGAAHGEACHKSTHTRAPHPPARPRARERTHTRTHTDQSACHRCYTQRTVPNACAADGYGRRRWLRLCPCGTQRSPFVTRLARCSRGGCGRSRCDRRAGSQPRLLPSSLSVVTLRHAGRPGSPGCLAGREGHLGCERGPARLRKPSPRPFPFRRR